MFPVKIFDSVCIPYYFVVLLFEENNYPLPCHPLVILHEKQFGTFFHLAGTVLFSFPNVIFLRGRKRLASFRSPPGSPSKKVTLASPAAASAPKTTAGSRDTREVVVESGPVVREDPAEDTEEANGDDYEGICSNSTKSLKEWLFLRFSAG